MTMTVLVLLFCAVVVADVQSAEVKRHVLEDPLISKFAGQELLLKTIEKIMVEKFAKLAGDVAGLRQELVSTKMEIADLKADVAEQFANSSADLKEDVAKSSTEMKQFIAKRLCPRLYDHNAYGCYKPVSESVSWDTAKTRCSRDGGHLAVIDTAEELQALGVLMGRMGAPSGNWYQIDGKKISGQWRWTSINRVFTYTNWYPGQPNDSGDTCLSMYYNPSHSHHLEWRDLLCTYTQYYICEV